MRLPIQLIQSIKTTALIANYLPQETQENSVFERGKDHSTESSPSFNKNAFVDSTTVPNHPKATKLRNRA